jgi:hypothetical protein
MKAWWLVYATLDSSAFCPHSAAVCFEQVSKQRAIVSLYWIRFLAFVPEMESVHVR